MLGGEELMIISRAKAQLEQYKATISELPANLLSDYAERYGYFNVLSYQGLLNQINLLTEILQNEDGDGPS